MMGDSAVASPCLHILLVEDSPTDVAITQRALAEARAPVKVHVVRDGEEALDFLYHRRAFAGRDDAPRPNLVLLDLNLPKVAGHEVLRVIKQDDDLKLIPVVVFTTSEREEDIEEAYRLGGNSYFSKPTEFQEYRKLLLMVEQYWMRLAKLPR